MASDRDDPGDLNYLEDPTWFACPSCDRMVTRLVHGTGPRNKEFMSRTHCCLKCERGEGHDSWWCCGTPSKMLRYLKLPDRYRDVDGKPVYAHVVVHEPNWDFATGPAPVLFFLHGAMTYLWPETLYQELVRICKKNAVAEDFIIIAPMAAIGESLSVVSDRRKHLDRFEKTVPYIDNFNTELTWEACLAACDSLGGDRVDWTRLSVTGFSMGAEATWNFAASRGSLLNAIAPMAGCALWPPNAWEREEEYSKELANLQVRAFSCQEDVWSYTVKDFEWMASLQRLPPKPLIEEDGFDVDALFSNKGRVKVVYRKWADAICLVLVRGSNDNHNCWDLVYQTEDAFGLFTWMASVQNPKAAELQYATRGEWL